MDALNRFHRACLCAAIIGRSYRPRSSAKCGTQHAKESSVTTETVTREPNVTIKVLPNGRVIVRRQIEYRNQHTAPNQTENTAAILEELGHSEEPVSPARLAYFLGITYSAARKRLQSLGLCA